VQLPPAEIRREAICTHTLSSKEARQVRSTCARAASPLRNATSMVCRFAAIKKIIFGVLFLRQVGLKWCARAHCRQTLAKGELGLTGNEAEWPSP